MDAECIYWVTYGTAPNNTDGTVMKLAK
jgi:hypothetical protein